jgi:hypothetical protein
MQTHSPDSLWNQGCVIARIGQVLEQLWTKQMRVEKISWCMLVRLRLRVGSLNVRLFILV